MTAVHALDSATPPTDAQITAAKQAGYRLWNGYIATHPNVDLLRPWTQADFDRVKALGGRPIAYCSGLDDPASIKALGESWGVLPCLDVEATIRPDGPWVRTWLDTAACGLYGTAGVHIGRTAAFHILAAYPTGGDPAGDTWDTAVTARPAGPCGWQYHGTTDFAGVGADLSWLDPWFGDDIVDQATFDALLATSQPWKDAQATITALRYRIVALLFAGGGFVGRTATFAELQSFATQLDQQTWEDVLTTLTSTAEAEAYVATGKADLAGHPGTVAMPAPYRGAGVAPVAGAPTMHEILAAIAAQLAAAP